MMWLGTFKASFMNGEIMLIDGGLSLTTSNYLKYLDNEEQSDIERAKEA